MIIETSRLYLRELTMNDIEALKLIFLDKENMKHYTHIFNEESVIQWIKRNQDRYQVFGFGLWAVCLKETNEVIGDCGLTMQNINGFIRPEVGFHMRKDMQRNGFAKEVANAVIAWTFQHTPFNEVYAYMKVSNIPSQKTAKAIGCEAIETYIDNDGYSHKVFRITKNNIYKV